LRSKYDYLVCFRGKNEIKRAGGVLVSPDEFASWRETIHIRCDADLMQEIKKGLSALKKDKVSLYTLEELFDTPA